MLFRMVFLLLVILPTTVMCLNKNDWVPASLEKGCADWGASGSGAPPIFSNLQESWSKGSLVGIDVAKVFYFL